MEINIGDIQIKEKIDIGGVEILEKKNIKPELEDLIINPTTKEQNFKSEKYGFNNVKVNKVTSDIDKNIKSENIKAGTTILGVDGNYKGVETSDATATANDILEGKTAYANNEKVTGTIEKYDGAYIGEASTTDSWEKAFVDTIEKNGGENITKLPSSLTKIGDSAFHGYTKLKLTELPSKVTSIGRYGFYGCYALTELTCLGDITSIGDFAFYICTALKKLAFPNITDIPTLEEQVFVGSSIENGTGYIYVPDNLVEGFKTATNWSTYANQIKPISEMGG